MNINSNVTVQTNSIMRGSTSNNVEDLKIPINDINLILGSDDEYFDYDTDTEEQREVKEDNQTIVTEIDSDSRKLVSNIDDILGSNEDYLDDDLESEGGTDSNVIEIRNDDGSINKLEENVFVNPRKPVSDIDDILGSNEEYFDDDKESDGSSNQGNVRTIQANLVENNNDNDDKEVKNSRKHVSDIDAILGNQEEYFDEDLESEKSVNTNIKDEINDLENVDENIQNSVDNIDPDGTKHIFNIDNILGGHNENYDSHLEDELDLSLNFKIEEINLNSTFAKDEITRVNKNEDGISLINNVLTESMTSLGDHANEINEVGVDNIKDIDMGIDSEVKDELMINEETRDKDIEEGIRTNEENMNARRWPQNFDVTEKDVNDEKNVIKRTITVNMGMLETKDEECEMSILMDLDVSNKNATFVATIPVDWTMTELDKYFEPRNLMNEINLGNRKRNKRFNIDVSLSFCNENLENSDLQIKLNAKKIDIQRNINEETETIDDQQRTCEEIFMKRPSEGITTKRYEFLYKLPEDELLSFDREGNSLDTNLEIQDCGDLGSYRHTKRYDFRYNLPQIKFPFIVQKDKSANPDGDEGTKRYDFRYQLSQLEFPSFGMKEKLSDEESNTESSPKRFDFRFQLPLFGQPEKSSDFALSSGILNEESPTKRFDFRYQLPQLEFPSFGMNEKLSDEELNTESSPKRFDFRFQLPKIEIPYFGHSEESSNLEENVALDTNEDNKTPTEKFDFSFQFPKIDLPCFGQPEMSADSDLPSDTLSEESPTKRFDFRFQLPKIEIPYFGNSEESSNINENVGFDTNEDNKTPTETFDYSFQFPKIDLPCFGQPEMSADSDLPSDTLNEESPTKRFDFRFQLSELEFLSLGNQDRLSDGDLNNESPTKRFDFRFQLPKIELPLFGQPEESSNLEGNVSLRSNDNNETPPERYDFRFQLPQLEFPSFGTKDKDQYNDEFNVDSPTKRFNFRFPIPKIEHPFFGQPEPSSDLDGNIDLDTNADIKKLPERYDFRFKFQQLEFPPFDLKDISLNKTLNANVDIQKETDYELSGGDLDIERSTKRGDFRFQNPQIEHPKIERPSFIDLNKSSNIDVDKIDRTLEPYDFRFQLPENELPLLSKERKSSVTGKEVNLNNLGEPIHSALDPNAIELSKSEEILVSYKSAPDYAYSNPVSSDEHSDIDLYPSPFRYVSLPYFSPRVAPLYSRSYSSSSSSNASLSPEIKDNCDISNDNGQYSAENLSPDSCLTELHSSTDVVNCRDEYLNPPSQIMKLEPFNDGIPTELTVNKPISFTGERSVDDNENRFSIIFEEYNSTKSDKFQIKLEKSILICIEYHGGKWQPKITRDIKYKSPDKNFRIIVIPKSHNEMLVMFNAEVVMEYHMTGSIDSLKRLKIVGSVKLNEVKLPD